jgi:hypothetical protein
MNTFCQKIEVGSHLYVNFGEGLHLHGETLIVSSLVVALISFVYFRDKYNIRRVRSSSSEVNERDKIILYPRLKRQRHAGVMLRCCHRTCYMPLMRACERYMPRC